MGPPFWAFDPHITSVSPQAARSPGVPARAATEILGKKRHASHALTRMLFRREPFRANSSGTRASVPRKTQEGERGQRDATLLSSSLWRSLRAFISSPESSSSSSSSSSAPLRDAFRFLHSVSGKHRQKPACQPTIGSTSIYQVLAVCITLRCTLK